MPIQTVLITGGTGFLGSAVIRRLLHSSYRVVALTRNISKAERLGAAASHPRLVFFNVDRAPLSDCFRNQPIDCVIHAATTYGRTGETMAAITRSNLLLPLELLELAVENNTALFINTDTFSNESIGLSSAERYYVKTKKDFLNHARHIADAADIKLVNMVMEQIYGPADNPTKFMPFIIGELLGNKPFIPLTPGEQKRDFIFVDDAAQAYLEVIKNTEMIGRYEEFGIGTGLSTSLRLVVEELKVITKSTSELQWGGLPYRTNEIMKHEADTSNNGTIGWQATVPLNEGLRQTVEFYQQQV